ncbi:MAG: hypothetical protein Q9169_000384 [Polycauliona sp. 2 TL-2023]
MAPESGTGPPRPGLSLYANLLEPAGSGSAAPGTISRAPVVFKQPIDGAKVLDSDASALRQQASAAPLLFRPTKRPQVSTQKPKSKSNLPKSGPSISGIENSRPSSGSEPNPIAQPPVKSTLSDWAAAVEDDDAGGYHAAEKRQRGGRKKRKKNTEIRVAQNWDDIYDPSRPNSYEEYLNSDEKSQEIRDWKDRLYAHRISRTGHGKDSSSDDGQPFRPKESNLSHGLSFAPPINFESTTSTVQAVDNATGDDAYIRRLKLSEAHQKGVHDTPQHETERTTAQPASFQPTAPSSSDHPPTRNTQSASSSISRAPVRYNLPLPAPEIPSTEAELADALENEDPEPDASNNGEAPRSLRPGQKGFAERLMSKYGWTKGSGLGASGSGIVNPLRVQIEKQKKKPDAEGGGFVGPGGRGKIIGGKKGGSSDSAATQQGPFGAMSEVIVLYGMIDGLDLDAELERADDGGLLQEIGEECGEKYGRVERAVNALNGRIFNGNAIRATFYDRETFDSGVYDHV